MLRRILDFARWSGLPLLLVLVLGGCQHIREQEERREYIHEKTKQHRYDRSCNQLGSDIEKVVSREGYDPEKREEDEYACPRLTRKESGPPGYIVRLYPNDSHDCRIEVLATETNQCLNIRKNGRDLELEWKVLQEVNPERADEIRANADRHAERAVE